MSHAGPSSPVLPWASAGAKELGQPEVGDVRLIVHVDEDVRRFQVAMKNALLVRVLHRPGQDAHVARGHFASKRSLSEPLIETEALDVLHREIMLAILV